MQEAQKRFEVAQKQYLRDQAAWRAAVVEVEEKAAAENAEAAAKVAAAQAALAAETQQRCFAWHALLCTGACLLQQQLAVFSPPKRGQTQSGLYCEQNQLCHDLQYPNALRAIFPR